MSKLPMFQHGLLAEIKLPWEFIKEVFEVNSTEFFFPIDMKQFSFSILEILSCLPGQQETEFNLVYPNHRYRIID